MIPRQLRIHLGTPSVDAAAQTFDRLKAVTLKISGRVHAARALMVVDHQQVGARPVGQNLLHKFLCEKMRARQFDGIEFLARPNIEQMNRLAAGETIGKFARLDLHRAIDGIARHNVSGDFVHIKVVVARANADECFLRAEAAARATTDVVAAEERPLRAGKLLEQLAHGRSGRDWRSGIHYLETVKALSKTRKSTDAQVISERAAALGPATITDCLLQIINLNQANAGATVGTLDDSRIGAGRKVKYHGRFRIVARGEAILFDIG
jgi:hypothetical protein